MAGDLDASLPTVVDLPDGSFELLPDPRPMRRLKLILGTSAVFNVGLAVAWLGWTTLWMPRIPWLPRLLPLAFILIFESLVWSALRPAVLRVDAMEIRSSVLRYRQRMPRSDLELIYRGQFKERSRKVIWVNFYLFVAHDGKVGLKVAAGSFLPEGMAELARRLGVPSRGDFSEKVKGTVDLSKTG